MGDLRRKIRIDIALPIYQSFLGGIFYKGHPLSAQRDAEIHTERHTDTQRDRYTEMQKREREKEKERKNMNNLDM